MNTGVESADEAVKEVNNKPKDPDFDFDDLDMMDGVDLDNAQDQAEETAEFKEGDGEMFGIDLKGEYDGDAEHLGDKVGTESLEQAVIKTQLRGIFS